MDSSEHHPMPLDPRLFVLDADWITAAEVRSRAEAPPETELTPSPVAAEPAQPRRRYAHRRYGRHYRAAWEPFPIYWPHFYRSRIHWSRIPWEFDF